MNILIRADGSTEIGSGHIMRCITLATMLREIGAEIYFVCRELEGNLCNLIEEKGFQCFRILNSIQSLGQIKDALETLRLLETQELKIDLVIVDHYQLDEQWEQVIRNSIRKIMVIDDLANRRHDCDLLLDQNYYNNFEKRYDNLVPKSCRKLLGLTYLLLRKEFYQESATIDKNNPFIKDILVFYGGSDPTNETIKVLDALNNIDCSERTIHVVVGLSNPNLKLIEKQCRKRNYKFYVQIDFIAKLMREADLAFGAGGVTMWERCFLGLPSIVTVVAENQKESTRAAAELGVVWSLGWHEGVEVSQLVDIMNRVIESHEELKKMSKKAKQFMQSDKLYKIHPVVEAILEVFKK